jgi:hypothetical protein
MDAQDTYMDVGGRVMQEQLPSDVVNSIRCEFKFRHSRVGGNPVKIYRLKGGLYLSVRYWFYHSFGFALNGDSLLFKEK